jgi:hypothetical protein
VGPDRIVGADPIDKAPALHPELVAGSTSAADEQGDEEAVKGRRLRVPWHRWRVEHHPPVIRR